MTMRARNVREAMDLAFSAARDAATRRAFKACRKVWSQEDYNAACREFTRVMEALGYGEES